jgi:predicted MFS family arabinose efflux permease
MSEASGTPKNFSEKTLLATLAAVNFTHIMDFMIMMPLGPKFMRAFDITPTQFGLLVSSYSFSAGAAGFAAGFFMDKFDRKTALTLLYACFMLGTLACAFAPNYATLMLARIIAGAGGGVAGSVILAIVGDIIPGERRGRAMGVIMMAFSLASVLGLPVGLFLADRFGWHAPFFLLVGLGVIVLIAIRRTLPELPPHPHSDDPGALARMRDILTHGNHLRAFTLVVALTAAGSLIYPFMSPSLVANAGMPESKLFMLYLLGGAATLLTSPFFGKLSDRHGKAKVFAILALISAVPTLVLTHLPQLPIPVILTATTVFFIFTAGRFVPLMALVTMSVEPKYRGAFMSVNSAIQQIAAGTATAVASMLVTSDAAGHLVGYGRTGWLSLALILLCIPLVRRLRVAGTPDTAPAPAELAAH